MAQNIQKTRWGMTSTVECSNCRYFLPYRNSSKGECGKVWEINVVWNDDRCDRWEEKEDDDDDDG